MASPFPRIHEPIPTMGLSEGATNLYGRNDELSRLRAALANALSGHGGLALVAGEAGLGKTTLVDALVAEASNQGAVVLSGHCYDPDAAPYEPWIELLRGYEPTQDLPDLPSGLKHAELLETLAGRDALFEEVAGFLGELTGASPVILVLEDLHWSDQASLDLLRAISRRIRAWPILIVATFRDNEISSHQALQRVLPLLVRENQPLRIALLPLVEENIRLLLCERYALPVEDEARLTDHLHRYAEGNPFYVTEVLHTLEQARLLRRSEKGWTVSDLSIAQVPPLVRYLIDDRVSRLGEPVQRLLQIAAVIGLLLPPDLWQAVAEVTDEAFAEAVDAARQANLIVETADRTALQFRHALVREALYDDLSLPRRRSWHRCIAERLAAQVNADEDAVAHHFVLSGDTRSADWLIRAAQRAERRDAAWDAIARYEQAIPLLEERGEADSLAWAHTDLAESYRYIDPGKAAAHLEIAARAARGAPDRVLQLAICWLELRLRGLQGHNVSDELRACYLGLEAISPEERGALKASGRFNLPSRGLLAQWIAFHGRYEDAIPFAEMVLRDEKPPETEADRNERGGAHLALALAHAGLGHVAQARTSFAAAREDFAAVGGAYMMATVLKWEWIEAASVFVTEDLAECRRIVSSYTAAMSRLGSYAVFQGERPLLQLFGPAMLNGHWSDVRESAEAYLGVPVWRVAALAALAEIDRRQGRLATAWTRIHAGLPDGPRTPPGGRYFVDMLRLQRVAAELALDEGKTDIAWAWIESHDRWLAWSGRILDRSAGLLLRARWHAARGEKEAARYAQEALERALEPRQPLSLLSAHLFLGTLATQGGDFDDADRHLRAALILTDACALPYERALVWLEQIRLQAARGEWSATLPLRKKVRDGLLRLEAAQDLARLDALEVRGLKGGLMVMPAGLSERQGEVLRLAAQGLSYAEIGNRLYISPRTVARHLQEVYNKLGVDSRAEAAAFAFAHDLV